MGIKFGFQPDPPSDKDWSFSNVRTKAVPIGFDSEYQIPDFAPVFNQGSIGSCTANAACNAIDIIWSLVDASKTVVFSRLFLYWIAREVNNQEMYDDGTYIRSVFDAMQDFGVCAESQWPYDVTKVFTKPGLLTFRAAVDNKLTGFYRIDSDGKQKGDDVESAIRFNHPVVLGLPIGQEFMGHYRTSGVLDIPQTKIEGNHAVCLTGVRHTSSGRQFLMKNSWGTSFGENGRAWITERYVIDKGMDLWVPTKTPELIL